jgi:hypothetical protein
LFGEQALQSVVSNVHYPHTDIIVEHNSRVVNSAAIIKISSKMLFRKNYKIGVLLTDGMNEFELASVLDTHVRTFPKSINTFSPGGKNVSSKFGLTLYPTGSLKDNQINELHVLDSNSQYASEKDFTTNTSIITYRTERKLYPIEVCLERITVLYGTNFRNCVKLTLDYN